MGRLPFTSVSEVWILLNYAEVTTHFFYVILKKGYLAVQLLLPVCASVKWYLYSVPTNTPLIQYMKHIMQLPNLVKKHCCKKLQSPNPYRKVREAVTSLSWIYVQTHAGIKFTAWRQTCISTNKQLVKVCYVCSTGLNFRVTDNWVAD